VHWPGRPGLSLSSIAALAPKWILRIVVFSMMVHSTTFRTLVGFKVNRILRNKKCGMRKYYFLREFQRIPVPGFSKFVTLPRVFPS
jgi:hypothetical protein